MSSVEATAVLAPNHEMVLQLTTDKEVHAFDLSEKFRVAVGRHPSNDIQLRSRRVSNYHAEILSEVEGLFVRDLGSTNGTYVNEESVRRRKLETGDCIRIGGFTLVVRLVPRSDADRAENGESTSERFSVGTVGEILPFRGQAASIEGSREGTDTTLPELLTEISRRSRSALVILRIEQEQGRIYFREGAILHCEHGGARRQKALYRLLALERGTYEIHDLPATPVPQTIEEGTDNLLMEGMQQLEALDKLNAKLPPMMCELALNESCGVPVNTLTADEIEIYQQLIRYRRVARVLDESEVTDFMVLLLTHALLQKGFFRTTNATGAMLEQTVIKGPQSA
jgi:hypothetical protein